MPISPHHHHEMCQAISLLAILGLDVGPFKRAAHDAQHIATHLGDHIKNAIGGVVTAFIGEEASRQTLEWGESVFNTAVKLNMTKKEVQQLDYALKLQGSSLLENTKFWELLAVARDKASRGAANPEQMSAFRSFGITDAMINDKNLSNVGLASIMASQIEEGSVGHDRMMASLRALGGRGAGEMVTAFKMGLVDLMNEAPVVSDKTIDSLKESADEMKAVFYELRAGIAPVLTWLIEGVSNAFHWMSYMVNFATGSVSEMIRQTGAILSHPLDFVKSVKDAKGTPEGFGMGEIGKAGKEQADEYRRSVQEASDARRKAMDRASKIHPGGESPEVQEARKILDLKEKLFKKQQQNDLESMAREQQIIELNKRRAAILEAMMKTQSEEGRINAAMDIEDIDSKLRNLRVSGSVETEKAGRNQRGSHDLNSLQRIGGMFVASPLENTTLDIAKRSEAHLREIKEHFKGGRNSTGWTHSKH